MLHVLEHSLLPNRLLDSPLCLHVEGICVHGFDRRLRLYMPRPCLAEQLRKPCRVILRRMRDFGLRLQGDVVRYARGGRR